MVVETRSWVHCPGNMNHVCKGSGAGSQHLVDRRPAWQSTREECRAKVENFIVRFKEGGGEVRMGLICLLEWPWMEISG